MATGRDKNTLSPLDGHDKNSDLASIYINYCILGGWVVVPVLGHVLKHVLRHVLGRHVPEHMLEHMPGHLPEFVSIITHIAQV